MIAKTYIEPDDKKKVDGWDKTRRDKLHERLKTLHFDTSETYVVGIDIADKNSSDSSVMLRYKMVNGYEYIFDGVEEI